MKSLPFLRIIIVNKDMPTLASATLRVIKIKTHTPDNPAKPSAKFKLINTNSINISRIIRIIITWYQRDESMRLISAEVTKMKIYRVEALSNEKHI